jgi:hypothetical protein
MAPFSKNRTFGSRVVILLLILSIIPLITLTSAEDYSKDYTGYLGETIMLHGVSYSGDTIYLFMTGPGLPANGVPLTDTTKRADQGYNTMVGLASDQTWSYKWDTAKLERQIDPGTYLVYAVNAPADASSLTGHSYQTLSVFLKDSSLSKERVSVGTKYTLNLLDDEPVTSVQTPAVTTPPTPVPTTVLPATTLVTTIPSPLPTKKSPVTPLIVLGVLAAGYLYARRRGCE